ncbi:hypothetical protein CEP73_002595 [Providencia stuartii]|uniref:hypothetical protein n=1 Tax=Providencia stuartii TaxID=588 RepID=UPI000B4DEFFF|nr:hypothetical protein [Providencia stuartii]PNL56488.1 hypothetical protein CEP73_002595 [Providencia stuartii]
MSEKWIPPLELDFIDFLNDGNNIMGLGVGSPELLITKVLGNAELPVCRLTKKKKILNYLYGNVNILTECSFIIGINIDFLSKRKKMIVNKKSKNWMVNDWDDFSKENNWKLSNVSDVLQLIGDNVVINLSLSGELGTASIR